MASYFDIYRPGNLVSAMGLGPCRRCGALTFGGFCKECWFNSPTPVPGDDEYDVKSHQLNVLCAEQNWRCCYCGWDWRKRTPHKRRPTIEHILPKSKGGQDVWENLAAACARCNSRRGNADIDPNWEPYQYHAFLKGLDILPLSYDIYRKLGT